MIRLTGVKKSYVAREHTTHVLKGVDVEIEQGEFVSIVGRSGSGKTTLLNIIGGLDGDYTGKVEVDGQDLHGLGDRELSAYRSRKVGFVFQSFHLLEHMSCLENAALPALFARTGETSAQVEKRAQEVLEQVGLADKIHARPSHLSGGQKQRVAIARALYNRPKLMVCDEPTGNLDRATAQSVLDIFTALNEDEGVTVLVVTHDDMVSRMARRTIQIEDGQIRTLDDGEDTGAKA